MSRREPQLPSSGLRVVRIAAFLVALGAMNASAQTVVVRSAPPGATISLTAAGSAAVTATADRYGDATLVAPSGTRGTSLQIRVDACGNAVSVFLATPGPMAGAEPGCTRKELWGLYSVHPTTTLVVEMNGTDAAVFVSQGPVPPEWVHRGEGPAVGAGRTWGVPSTGLALSAGVGLSSFSRAATVACGDATCTKDTTGIGTSLSAEYWVVKFAAAFVSMSNPADATVDGSGTGFRFNSSQHARLVSVGGKGGAVAGPARIYGIGGVARHEATINATQTNDPKTITVNDVAQTIPGGTQLSGLKTTGWGLTFGGGVEVWLAKRVAFYGEFTRTKLKATPKGATEGGIDDQLSLAVVGIRFRLLP